MKAINDRIHLIIGHFIEMFDKGKALEYFKDVMKPYNESPLYEEYNRLWREENKELFISLKEEV